MNTSHFTMRAGLVAALVLFGPSGASAAAPGPVAAEPASAEAKRCASDKHFASVTLPGARKAGNSNPCAEGAPASPTAERSAPVAPGGKLTQADAGRSAAAGGVRAITEGAGGTAARVTQSGDAGGGQAVGKRREPVNDLQVPKARMPKTGSIKASERNDRPATPATKPVVLEPTAQ